MHSSFEIIESTFLFLRKPGLLLSVLCVVTMPSALFRIILSGRFRFFCFTNIGQEDDTIAFDGEITIMPFNMKEEMETGHFDTAGTYIFSKEVSW